MAMIRIGQHVINPANITYIQCGAFGVVDFPPEVKARKFGDFVAVVNFTNPHTSVVFYDDEARQLIDALALPDDTMAERMVRK